MDSVVTLSVLAGALGISIGLGWALEKMLVGGIFKLLPLQAHREFSKAPERLS